MSNEPRVSDLDLVNLKYPDAAAVTVGSAAGRSGQDGAACGGGTGGCCSAVESGQSVQRVAADASVAATLAQHASSTPHTHTTHHMPHVTLRVVGVGSERGCDRMRVSWATMTSQVVVGRRRERRGWKGSK